MVGKDTFLGWGGLPALLGCWAIVVLYLLVRRRRLVGQPQADDGRLRRWGLAITAVNVAMIAGLCAFGPSTIVTDQELRSRLPIYLGLTGYRLVLQPAQASAAGSGSGRPLAIAARIGPEPLVWPPPADSGANGVPYYLVVPGLAAEDESGRAPNAASTLQVRCDRSAPDTRCTLTLAAGERRRDYLPAVERDGRWQWVGSQPIASGQSITIDPAAVKGAGYGPRTVTVRHDGGDVLFNDCRVRAPETGEVILPAADLYFFHTDGGCRPREIQPEDSERGLWLRPAADGGTEIPAYSFLAVRAGPSVDLVALDDRAFVVNGPAGARAEPVNVPVVSGAPVRVAVLRRRFQERSIPKTCAAGDDLRDCLRLTGTLEPLAWTVRVDVTGQQGTLAIDIDRESAHWRPLAWSAFTPDRLELDGVPIRFAFEQGRWRSGEPRPRSSHEQPLELPFRLLGGLPYSAQFLPRLEGIDRASLVVHDSARRPRVFAAGERFELGPPEARAVVEFERARSSKRLARAALAPLAAVAIGILLFQLLVGPWERLQAAALLVGCAAVVVTYGQLLRAHAGYALVVHEPWDHSAFQQIAESSFGLALVLAASLLVAVAWLRLSQLPLLRRPSPESRAVAVAALLLLFAVIRGVLSFTGNERLGPVRLVLFAPVLAVLIWHLLGHAAGDAEAGRTWRWLCERLRFRGRRAELEDNDAGAGRWRLICLGVSVLSVAAWFRDLGALLLVLVPISLAFVVLWGPRARGAKAALLAVAGGMVALGLIFPSLFGKGVLAWKRIQAVPALAVGHQGACGSLDGGDNRCGLRQGDRSSPGDSKALDLLERAELTSDGRPASRRHSLRLLDWYEDGNDSSTCFAAERFSTNEALEVAFFRAQVRHYRAAREQVYLRDGLLPFAPAVQRAFVADYLGAVAFAPQLPRGSLVATALALLVLLVAAALVFPVFGFFGGGQSGAGAAGFGALTFLTCASVLTVAANLDLLPNFAQNLPLVAVRSGSAWVIDALSLLLALCLLAAPEEKRS
jgi:hypothetical protein